MIGRCRLHLVRATSENGLVLRQNYNRYAPSLVRRIGRVWCDIERQLESLLSMAKRALDQKQTDQNKLCALHAPEVECISKGKRS